MPKKKEELIEAVEAPEVEAIEEVVEEIAEEVVEEAVEEVVEKPKKPKKAKKPELVRFKVSGHRLEGLKRPDGQIITPDGCTYNSYELL